MGERSESVDWTEVKARIAAVSHALERAERPAPEESRRILEQRAVALATPAASPPTDEIVEVVTFTIDDELNGIVATGVAEVRPLSELALLPGARPPVAGLTAWRGELLTVLDVSRRPPRADPAPWLVVVQTAAGRFGLAADQVNGIVELPLMALPPPGAPVAAYVRAVTTGALRVLDPASLSRLYR
jgi:purine-binding chemotaxis protein CheW